MRRYIIVLLSMLAICSVPCQSQTIDRALFERMVAITKHFEGWHDPKTTPGYVGYGHQLQKGERFPKTLTRQRADLLLRTDNHICIHGMSNQFLCTSSSPDALKMPHICISPHI